jgi:hypothetical protein
MPNAECSMNSQTGMSETAKGSDERPAHCLCMRQHPELPAGKPFDIHERLELFAGDIVRAAQNLHDQGGIARALSYQVLASGTSAGANAEEGDGASSRDDFIAKHRIAARRARSGIRAACEDPRQDRAQRNQEQASLIIVDSAFALSIRHWALGIAPIIAPPSPRGTSPPGSSAAPRMRRRSA